MKYIASCFSLFLFSFLLAWPSFARPVSYPGGWTFMTRNDVDFNSSHIHYTPSPKYSIGWRHEYMRESGVSADTLQLNWLAKRWNMPGSQANFYIKSGIGAAYDSDDIKPAAFTGMAVDWEDRRYFTSYQNRFFTSSGLDNFSMHRARVGIAPYIGDYGDIHTLLMLQSDYQPGKADDFSMTPLVRFFKGASMLEAGANLDGGMLFNFIHRF